MTKIGKLIKSIGNFFAGLFKNITLEARELVPEIIQIVTNIKNFVDSPGCDFITSVIPGTLDDKIQDILKSVLTKLLNELNKVESIAVIEDENERLKAIVNEILSNNTDVRDILLHGIAGKLIQKTTNVSWGQGALLAEGTYQYPELLSETNAA